MSELCMMKNCNNRADLGHHTCSDCWRKLDPTQEEKGAMDRIEVRVRKMREDDEAHRNEIHARISEAIGELDRDYSPHDIVMAIADGNIPHLKIEY